MNNSQLGGFAIEFLIGLVFLIVFIVMAVRIGKIKKILEKIDKRLPMLLLFFALSFSAYSQCHLPLKTEVIKFCGQQTTVTAPIVDSPDFHYHWYYPNDTIAPYANHSFTLNKKEYDNLCAIMKKTFPFCSNCAPFFRLQVVSDSGCISDKIYMDITGFPMSVETPEICLITVDSANHNHLIIAKPAISPDSIVIQKLTGASWKSVKTIKRNDLLEFTDEGSTASLQTYSYRLFSYAWDSCLLQTNVSKPSVAHTSILLQISPSPVGGYNLSWSRYVGLADSELLGYFIYRGPDYSSMEVVDTTQSLNNVAWNDPNSENSDFFYVIEAVKKNGCDVGQRLKKELSVRSNTALRKTNGINSLPQKPVFRLENSILYTDKPCEVYIVNGIGQVTFSGKSNGELPLTFTKGLNIIMVDGKAVLKKMY